MEQQCSNCRYFYERPGGQSDQCRLNPLSHPVWHDHWCGQWTAATPTTYDATLHRIALEENDSGT